MSNRYLGGFITNTPTQPTTTSAPGVWTLSQVSQAVGNSIWPPAGFFINNSLRFRSSASAYLNRTPASATNQNTWTFSAWDKRGVLGSTESLFSCNTGSVGYYFYFGYNSSDNLVVYSSWGTVKVNYVTTQVFRDPSAWYHIVLAVDFTQSTGSAGVKLYINGVQVTSFSTSTYSSSAGAVNGAYVHNIGRQADTSSNYFDGYLADINFIDGQALTPSSFGQISTVTGVWQPKAYSGTYGTNGFKLNFSNGTSTTTLGYDSSGNSNNWTTNNISLTAGSTYDWMLDSPTPFAGSSYGVGNYCVFNPNDTGGGSVTISGGNLNYTIASSTGSQVRGSVGSGLTGKWYWEFVNGTIATAVTPVCFGISTTSGQITNNSTSLRKSAIAYTDGATNRQAFYYLNGTLQGSPNIQFTSAAIGDIFQVAYDADSGKLWFGKNNTWYDASNTTTGNPASGTNPVFTIATGDPMTPFVSNLGTTYSGSLNCGQRPFAYTPPTGYKSLCTYNLPTPSIVNGAGYMAATLYTGNATTQNISNAVNAVSFQPDLVWLKNRTSANNNWLMNSVAGATNGLISNATTAEQSVSPDFAGFSANGFNLNSASNNFNGSAQSYVAWQWKAGGTASSNTNGTITSQVSVSALSGFSVVTYTGTLTGAGTATVGHGLGVAPSMIIAKGRNAAGGGWPIYHVSVGVNKFLELNTTGAVTNDTQSWQAVSATTISVGQDVCQSGTNWVAYCFAAIPGYSAFGSYTGNGSTDGPFIYTGFRPRWILTKRTDSSVNSPSWILIDTARSPYNSNSPLLFPNASDAESAASNWVDILSNGFKVRNTDSWDNASAGTYIYAAFAENPFQNALAR